jgi:N-acylneuraminate cytidylyltransferase
MDRMVKPRVIAVIPARGGSKSIPRKNVRSFAGHPLIAYAIEAGLSSSLVERVVVSTDDARIAEVARRYGAEVPFMRPPLLAQDDTPDLPVFVHVLDHLRRFEGYRPQIIVQLRPTSPLRPPGLVDDAIRLLCDHPDADSVRAVTSAEQTPYKMWRRTDTFLTPLLSHESAEPFNMPRQQLPQVYWQTGHVDAFRIETVLEKNSLTGDRILPVAVDGDYAIDIDDLRHWRFGEWVVANQHMPLVQPDHPHTDALRHARLLVLDFDGVLTDNRVYVDSLGRESVACSRADGLGIEKLRILGIRSVVLSRETDSVVAARCHKLGIECVHGVTDKLPVLERIAASEGIAPEQVIYVGNDVNDLECLAWSRLGVAPADAHPEVLAAADWVLQRDGGDGAVRELCDLVAASRQGGKAHAQGKARKAIAR